MAGGAFSNAFSIAFDVPVIAGSVALTFSGTGFTHQQTIRCIRVRGVFNDNIDAAGIFHDDVSKAGIFNNNIDTDGVFHDDVSDTGVFNDNIPVKGKIDNC